MPYDKVMYTVTIFGVFLISFLVSFVVFSAVVCYLCIKMEIIEMRLIVRKPKRKLSNVCLNSRSNIYEVIEDKKGNRHLYDKLMPKN